MYLFFFYWANADSVISIVLPLPPSTSAKVKMKADAGFWAYTWRGTLSKSEAPRLFKNVISSPLYVFNGSVSRCSHYAEEDGGSLEN